MATANGDASTLAAAAAAAPGAIAPASAEDVALKKNTDCVYFLASPLTCKKGEECEFRHSEAARINPRDCWYWVSGSCLNRDCPFRHPPLEAGNPTPGQQQPASNKGRTPCYFFIQGYCAKGDRCPFLHGVPKPTTTAPPELEVPPRSEAAIPSKPSLTAQKPSVDIQLQAIAAVPEARPAPPSQVAKPAGVFQVAKPAAAATQVAKPAASQVAKPAPPTQIAKPVVKPSPPAQVAKPAPSHVDRSTGYTPAENVDRYTRESTGYTPAENGNGVAGRSRSVAAEPEESAEPVSSTHEDDDLLMTTSRAENGTRDPEERWEESSPGFDVLVDDGPEESEFLHGNNDEAGDRFDDDYEFQYSEMYNQTGGFESGPPLYERESYDRIRHENGRFEQGEYTDYDAPYDRMDFDRPPLLDNPERDYFRQTRQVRTQSIKERLRFNHQDPRPFLDNGDLRNVLERRRRLDVYPGREGDDRFPREFTDRERHRDDFSRGRERDRAQNYFHQARLNSSSGRRSSRERSNERFHHRHPPPDAFMYRGGGQIDRRPVKDASPPGYEARNFGQGFSRRTGGEEPSDFAAPKSLAQIRAEKRKLDGEEVAMVSSSKRSYISRESRFHGGELNGGGDDGDQHFEGPKPLHEILKDKRREEFSQLRRHDESVIVASGEREERDSRANGVANHHVHADKITTTTVTAREESDDDEDDDDDDFAKKLGGYFS
ncbi:hypothetical protein SELMODRAFT_441325 [Selaginella moellendorffii]|uniref:C3H1-type domain-containing protein n=1 Tax=Selaginella moellendorffii TaxID=88036 RepID=D8RIL4_SELML|nr:zinc finger CCCH domain-containing protein 32 [Selaginella moellendorffii]EFJ28110.1 hypothetical protein SELMODRAFT_441325 [Selaginella moellendorffii]|eukprot:XP_002970784.1 zinc finger CCCH domain-containing protein 32 [Selaginella moellendorffii]